MIAKYIKTKNNEIIVFSELQLHLEFRMFEPISAGFIKIDMFKLYIISIKLYSQLRLCCHFVVKQTGRVSIR